MKNYLQMGRFLLCNILLLVLLTGCGHTMGKKYNYSVEIGYPAKYNMIYEYENSYLADEKGNPLMYFGIWMTASQELWGDGSQSTVLSMENPLPSKIKVRWLSVTENQFWEGEWDFDPNLLKKFFEGNYRDVMNQETSDHSRGTFIINVVPGGMVTVWLSGGTNQFLIAQFQAQKIEVDNIGWQNFEKYTLESPLPYPTQTIFIEKMLSDEMADSIKDAEEIRQQIADGNIPDSKLWKRLMVRYPWKLKVSEHFKLDDYYGRFTNGERYYIYKSDVRSILRPVPYFLTVYLRKPDGELERISIEMDKEEVLKVFEEASRQNNDAPMELFIDETADLTYTHVYVRKGDFSYKLKTESALEDLYN